MPPQKETADPVRTRSAAESESTLQGEVYNATRLPKTGRTRYLRIFPERALFLLDRLDDAKFVAAFRLILEYVMRDGRIDDNDQALARITKLSGRGWAELKEILIELGVGRVDNGRWIDDDQQANLDHQQGLSERGKRGAAGRWGGRHA